MRLKSFASIEALLALLFVAATLAFLMPSFSPRASFTLLHAQQLANDLAEVSLSNTQTLSHLTEFSHGSERAKAFLRGKYERIGGLVGDYCFKVEADGNSIETHCNGVVLKAKASRIVFDGNGFFDLTFSVGFKG